jgi:hypothetical protein
MMLNNETKVEKNLNRSEQKKVEVSVDGDTAVIRMFSYAEGIGWFVQKTITVDADLLDVLTDQLAIMKGKIVRENDEILSAEILEF